MTNGSCHRTQESKVHTWLKPAASARLAVSTTRRAGGSVCSTTPMSIWHPLPQVLAGAARQEPAAPGRSVPRAAVHEDLAAGQHGGHRALHLAALVGGVVDRHVVGGRGQHVRG